MSLSKFERIWGTISSTKYILEFLISSCRFLKICLFFFFSPVFPVPQLDNFYGCVFKFTDSSVIWILVVSPISGFSISDTVFSLLEFPFGSSCFFFLSFRSFWPYFPLHVEHNYSIHFKFLIVNSKHGQSVRFFSNVFSLKNESLFPISLYVKKF